jgi:hypothetical protein
VHSGSEDRYSTSTAFILWLAWLFGLGGVHRFYLGKPWSGILYMLTWGLFGVGQVIDLVRLRGMVSDENLNHEALLALAEKRALRGRGPSSLGNLGLLPPAPPVPPPTPESLRMKLLEAASQRNGQLSVTEGVMATGRPFEEVEAELDAMAKSGYVGISNDPDTGMVVYTFGQLAK